MAPVTSGFGQENEKLDDAVAKFLGLIWEHYKDYTPLELSALTHRKGTPWDKATRKFSRKDLSRRSISISNEIIRDYYGSYMAECHAFSQALLFCALVVWT